MKISVAGDSSYFVPGNEFRVCLEWIKGENTGLAPKRDKAQVLYIPIETWGLDMNRVQ